MICILTSVSVFMKGIEGKGGDSGRASGVQCLPTAHLNPLSARQELDPSALPHCELRLGLVGGEAAGLWASLWAYCVRMPG